MMKTKLILLTVSFPYGKAEHFLELEINYLAKMFSEIEIIPVIITSECRKVPDNVYVRKDFSKKMSLFWVLMAAFQTKDTYIEIVRNPFILLSFQKMQRLFSFMGRGYLQYKFLKNNYFNQIKVLYYSYWFNGSSYALYLLNNDLMITYVFRAHGGDLYLEPNKGYLPFRKPVLKAAKAVFVISRNGMEYLKEKYVDDFDIPILLARLGTKKCKKNFINKEMGKGSDSNTLNLISCSNIVKVKRLDLIIKSLKLFCIQNKNIKVYWTHIGDGELYSDILQLTANIPSNFKVRFTGYMSNREVMDYYSKNNFDLFINLSESEGLPVSIMEAMSCSIPVMATNVGGVNEIVNEGNGILLPANVTPFLVAKEIKRIMKNKEILQFRGKNAYKTWNRMYNAEKNYKNFANYLYQLISESK